ncbi:WD40-like Beta Propeller Repeat [Saccharicrinis carchari]|uniref:WD40-like Beta Propeller Repeat n=2 Tax=Saccharicrinis carchari TaxID=1168039 RepID=A0A521DBX1_SACCC|nr:WD40-like Beta Propeller Repeat [Saccharicrinis carchari]
MELADRANYRQAIETFKLIIQNDPTHLDALFNMGLCYLNTSNGADTAIICFNKGLNILTETEKKGHLGRELGLSMGKAYQVLLKPLKAITIYENLLDNTTEQDRLFIEELEREIQICHHANFFINYPIELNVQNMGSRVNSMYDDHSPLIAVSESQLFFTSRRNWIKMSLLADGQYAEKIYTVPLAANNWESARLLKVFFKQNEHEAAVSLSPDGNELVLFRNDEHGKSLYISHYNGRSWSEPEKLPFPINSHAEETHGSISADKSTFFFTSDRENGYGGLDIYMSKKLANGQWGEPRNLGPNINTPFDEETPMIHYDGRTLYFSSEGHNTMGRLDVFYSQMNTDSTWSAPVNMGFPINTPDDDFFFVPTISKSHAYYASSKFDDNYGGSDIYQVHFKADSDTELAVIEGVIDSSLGSDFEKMRVLVTRTNDNKLVGDYRPNPDNGAYMMFLENGYEYEVRQTNINKQEKVAYINVDDQMNYIKHKIPIAFNDVAMDAPLIKTEQHATKAISTNKNSVDKTNPVTSLPVVTIADESSSKTSANTTITNTAPIKRKPQSHSTTSKPKVKTPDTSSNPSGKLLINQSGNNSNVQSKKYTIQLLALRKGPLSSMIFFTKQKIHNIMVYNCTDGYIRYTTGNFDSYKACLQLKKKLAERTGLKDIWIRPIKDIEALQQQ